MPPWSKVKVTVYGFSNSVSVPFVYGTVKGPLPGTFEAVVSEIEGVETAAEPMKPPRNLNLALPPPVLDKNGNKDREQSKSAILFRRISAAAANPVVYFHFARAGAPLGRLAVELRMDLAPFAVTSFLAKVTDSLVLKGAEVSLRSREAGLRVSKYLNPKDVANDVELGEELRTVPRFGTVLIPRKPSAHFKILFWPEVKKRESKIDLDRYAVVGQVMGAESEDLLARILAFPFNPLAKYRMTSCGILDD